MTLREQGRDAGLDWSSFATLSEVNRLDGALFEHAAENGEDFVGQVFHPICGSGFANALAVIATGDDDVDVDAYLASRGLKRDLLDQPEYAVGFIHGALDEDDAVVDADAPAIVEK